MAYDTTNLRAPKISISGVPIPEASFVWALTAGVQPYQTSITVTKGTLHNSLAALANPVTIETAFYGGTTSLQARRLMFEKIYLLEPREIDPFHFSWSLADSRFLWRGKKVWCGYNKTRQINDVRSALEGQVVSNPGQVRQYYDIYFAGRYVPWSVKSDGKPHTVREILNLELDKAGIPYQNSDPADESYILENLIYDGVDFSHFVADLCNRARMQVAMTPPGILFVYSVDSLDYGKNGQAVKSLLDAEKKTKPGQLYRQDLRRVRPYKITVKFEKKIETRVVAVSSEGLAEVAATGLEPAISTNSHLWSQEDMYFRKVIGCENVIKVPYPYQIDKITKIAQVGEYMPMWQYLAAYGLTETDVQTRWFNNQLEMYLAYLFTTLAGSYLQANYALAGHIASAIKSHYRQVYMIDPFLLPQIKSWETRRVAVIDNYSHYSPPSPCWVDYCTIPRIRVPAVAKGLTTWDSYATNWVVDTYDYWRRNSTMATVTAENPQLGVFRVTFPGDLTQVVQEVVPSAVASLPPSKIASAALWNNASLKATHTMEALLSLVWDANSNHTQDPFNFPRKYWEIPFQFSDGQGPPIEYLSKLDVARLQVREYDEAGNYKPESLSGDPLNRAVLGTLAGAEVSKLYNSYRDRLVGSITVSDLCVIFPQGHISAVRFIWSSTGVETEIDARDIPPAPVPAQVLPQPVINYLYRHVSTDSSSEGVR